MLDNSFMQLFPSLLSIITCGTNAFKYKGLFDNVSVNLINFWPSYEFVGYETFKEFPKELGKKIG